MRAAVMQGLHLPLIVEEVADPSPGEGQVVVQVARCGICGSDLHMTEDPAFNQHAGSILGHEFAGEIVAVGRGVASLVPGDAVAVSPLASCGHCEACRAGTVQWCAAFGLQAGGYAQYALTAVNQCLRLPATASLEDGALVEPLAVALHGVMAAQMPVGARVLVIGAGPIGLAVAFWARRRGAARVIVQDLADWQRERAIAMGAHALVTVAGDGPHASELALGGKADIAFDCVGAPGVIDQAVALTRALGSVVQLGLCSRPDTINTFAMLTKEVRLITSAFFTRQEYEASLDAVASGAAEPSALVTSTIGLEKTPQVFEALRRRTSECKVMIAPNSS